MPPAVIRQLAKTITSQRSGIEAAIIHTLSNARVLSAHPKRTRSRGSERDEADLQHYSSSSRRGRLMESCLVASPTA
jgi:hypothetical protein